MKASALFGLAALAASSLVAPSSEAAPSFIDRPITLPRLNFAANLGLGIAHAHPTRDLFGPGMNLEGALGITDSVEIGLRTGLRFGDDARLLQADMFGLMYYTETRGTLTDVVANPEFHLRWAVYSGQVVEVGLDGRVFLPIEQNSRFGMMFGLPLAFHISDFMRIDT